MGVGHLVGGVVAQQVLRAAPGTDVAEPVGQRLAGGARPDRLGPADQLGQREGLGERVAVEHGDLAHVHPLHADDEVGPADQVGVDAAAAVVAEVEAPFGQRGDGIGR